MHYCQSAWAFVLPQTQPLCKEGRVSHLLLFMYSICTVAVRIWGRTGMGGSGGCFTGGKTDKKCHQCSLCCIRSKRGINKKSFFFFFLIQPTGEEPKQTNKPTGTLRLYCVALRRSGGRCSWLCHALHAWHGPVSVCYLCAARVQERCGRRRRSAAACDGGSRRFLSCGRPRRCFHHVKTPRPDV